MKPFLFKQFKINHKQSAHKVGTDGVLLGAWVSFSPVTQAVLDVGAGSGLIALMIAQRSFAESIDAIEINSQAFEECVNNFENSPWNDRLFCYHGDVKTLAKEPGLKYDLIVSNPPYFESDSKSYINGRTQARLQQSLNYEDLLNCACLLLNSNGQFALILPYKEHRNFICLAKAKGLYLNRLTHVKGQKHLSAKRSLMQFSFSAKDLDKNDLVIEKSRHLYTDEYRSLVKDFYLNL